ncbi:MAG: N-6 DNA methylase [Candidatus Helarchaeota archaeon]|nr:N-6 DNA methylase [Candidatus Helarchaeota archaeon]
MKKLRTFFCYLSGELPSKGLPSHEVIAILKLFNEEIKNFYVYDQVLLVSSKKNICKEVAEKAAYVHRCGELIFSISDVNLDTLRKELRKIDFDEIFKNEYSFAVRIKKIKDYFPEIFEEKIEREIGRIIEGFSSKIIKVNLENPEILFFGIFTENKFFFGINYMEVKRKELRQRAPHRRPFFHPCGLDPFLARAMVNLAETKPPVTLYDPFCGSGSILIEAALMGFKIIGSDISQKMVRGSSLNLKAISVQDFSILKADARKPCLNKISNLVTDPPYGRASSIYGKNLENLLSDFFRNNVDLIDKNSLSILALPSTLKISAIASEYNFKIQHKFEYYVHRSLTRDITVLKKT